MFFRRALPGLCRRWGFPNGPGRRWMAGRNVPVFRPWHLGPGPWSAWRDMPSPFGMMARVEREFEDMWRAMNTVWGPPYRNRYPTSQSSSTTHDVRVNYDDKTFQLYLNVIDYNPDDLHVKVVDQTIEVRGKHIERPDEHGSITREFTRYITIPEDVDPDSVACELGDDGQMIISANVKGAVPTSERVINIEKKAKPTGNADTESRGSQ